MIKGPITKHLPVGATRLGLSRTAEETVRLPAFYDSIPWAPPPVLVVGAMAHGHLDITYVDKCALHHLVSGKLMWWVGQKGRR